MEKYVAFFEQILSQLEREKNRFINVVLDIKRTTATHSNYQTMLDVKTITTMKRVQCCQLLNAYDWIAAHFWPSNPLLLSHSELISKMPVFTESSRSKLASLRLQLLTPLPTTAPAKPTRGAEVSGHLMEEVNPSARHLVLVDYMDVILEELRNNMAFIGHIKCGVTPNLSKPFRVVEDTADGLKRIESNYECVTRGTNNPLDRLTGCITTHCDSIEAMWTVNKPRFYIGDLDHFRTGMALSKIEWVILHPENGQEQNKMIERNSESAALQVILLSRDKRMLIISLIACMLAILCMWYWNRY